MNLRAWMLASLLLLLAVATAGGMFWTRDPGSSVTQGGTVTLKKGFRRVAPHRERVVDQTPLQTARSLAALAVPSEEQQLAHEAVRLANHEVDLAFADALRRTATDQVTPTQEMQELLAAKNGAATAVEASQQLVSQLTKHLAAAKESQKGSIEDQLEVAKAQLELNQDELEAASTDLQQAGGDPQAKIRRLKEAHEAVDKETPVPQPSPNSLIQAGSLLARFREWTSLRSKFSRLTQARQEALDKVRDLTGRREKITARIQKEKDDREAAQQRASNLSRGPGGGGRSESQDAAISLRHFVEVQHSLASMGKRVQDQQGLAEVYGNWMALAESQEILALHRLLNRLLWVITLVLLAYLAGFLVDHLFHRVAEDNKSAGTLRVVVRLLVQVFCLFGVLFLILGVPDQTTTMLGLAGAGLTVAMKDFIVAFFGWFILMGRNGIRVGDWVEIRGVGGEVVEIGFLRTVVMETGSWNDAGHPTGRRVAFVNSFAIEGHFFNFSTSGKWMWDELSVLIPTGQDPYPIIDRVQKLLEKETEANARLAEQEWQTATARYHVQAFSAAPGLNVVPTASGVEIRGRYITRAFERHEIRQRLNQAVVELMHGPRVGDGTPIVKAEA
jgi:small-conductance mechanosensitive channel